MSLKNMFEDERENPEVKELVPQPCIFCKCQANIEATLRPAMWFPGFRSPHYYKESWKIGATPIVCFQEFLNTIKALNIKNSGDFIFNLAKANEDLKFIQVHIFSFWQNLYVVEVKFTYNEEWSATQAQVRCFCSGWLPVWVPLSFLWNSVFSLVPFCDYGKNKLCIKLIRKALILETTVVKKGRGC